MKHILILVFCIIGLFFTHSISYSKQPTENNNYDKLENKVNIISDSIKEIRRDQLNYKLEKDLLKETFSSTFQTVNIIISFVLGIITLLFAGFSLFGLKSINTLKSEIKSELDSITQLKLKYESAFEEIKNDQKRTLTEFSEIKKTNEDQDIRLKILEIQEKASNFFSTGDYLRALNYVKIGITMSSDDELLTSMLAACLSKLKKYDEATEAYENFLKTYSSDYGQMGNLCEIYLLRNRLVDYKNLITKNSDGISVRLPDIEKLYFNVLYDYRSNDFNGMKTKISDQVTSSPEKLKRLDRWQFHECTDILNDDPSSDHKKLLLKYIQYLNNELSGEDVIL